MSLARDNKLATFTGKENSNLLGLARQENKKRKTK